MKKRTIADQVAERESIEMEAIRLIKALAAACPGTRAEQSCLQKMRVLARRIANRERQDRCYYCGSRKKELGQEADTGLCQCIDCAGDVYTFQLQVTRTMKERLNDGYML